jgi:hypothetical protein
MLFGALSMRFLTEEESAAMNTAAAEDAKEGDLAANAR